MLRTNREPSREDPERELYQRFRPLVLGFLARRLRNLEEAEAATHEVFVRAIRQIRDAGPPEHLAAWLLTVARHLVVDRARRAGAAERGIPGLLPQRSTDPDGVDLHRLRNAVAGLPPDLRDVVRLRYEDDLSFAEIGVELGLSKNACFARHQRAIEVLRGRFDPPEGDP